MHNRVKCMEQQVGSTRLQISDRYIKSELHTRPHSTGVHGGLGALFGYELVVLGPVWSPECGVCWKCDAYVTFVWEGLDFDISAGYQKVWPLFPPSASSSKGYKDLEARANHEEVWFWCQILMSVVWFFESLKNHRFGFFQYSKIKELPVPLLWKN